ncbi:MAG TPA: ABC transporter substrate-binding protein [Sporichthyaceae bacterium]
MNNNGWRRRRTRMTVAAVAALSLALVTGCGGNRVNHDRVVAAGNGYGPAAADENKSLVQAAADAAAAKVAGQAPAVAGPSTLGTGPGAPAASAGGAAPAAGTTTTATGAPAATTNGATAKGGTAGATTTAAGASTACTATLSPIVIGQTLASSGLVGAAISGLRTGLAVWVRDVNARGGVQCHPIQLTQLDDGSDPAKVASNWNTIIHDKGGIAMVGGGVPIAIAALRSAAERDKVPVVGGDITAVDWTQSPYLFPTGGAPLTSYDGAVVEAAALVKGTPKAGIFYCVEASICTGLKNNFPKSVQRAKVELGPSLAVSLTQPDFTSECQQMKASKVNLIFFGLDGSASIRAARSCASLNYYPIIATGAIAVSAQAAADQGLRHNNTFLGSGVVPYTTNDSAAIQAFHAAMKLYAPSNPEDQQTLLGWASGKLFEAALAKEAAKARAGNVTTAMVLDGLWQLKSEKLGGLTPGATFVKGDHAVVDDCYYPLKLDAQGFSAPKGSKPVCYGSSAKIAGVAPADAAVPAPDLAATKDR